MMIKVAGEFLDFNEEIEIERQIKLFEDIDSTNGDFSYTFELPKTLNNTRLLSNPFPDNKSKLVYTAIPAMILGDSGAELYKGYIRVDRITHVFECSFFAGNNNWFAQLTGLLSELDLSRYDTDNNEVTIINSWTYDEGLVFPLIDNGGLLTRSTPQLKIEDFVPGFYVKTIFKQIFSEAGIKIQGELLEDWRYQHLICVANSKDQGLIDAGTSYVEKNQDQVLPNDALVKVTWDNDSTLPFFDGSLNAFDLPSDRYVAPYKSTSLIELTLVGGTTGILGITLIFVRVNGTDVFFKPFGFTGTERACSLSYTIPLETGDVVEIYQIQSNGDGDAGVINRGTIKITPVFVYSTTAAAAIPNWTKQHFVSNIFRLFNVLPSYEPSTATLTVNLFDKIKDKTPVDLSEYISETEVDYTDFISDYAQRSMLGYQEVDFEELQTYNKGKFIKYGQGVIEVNNDFLESDDEILSSDFANPVAYTNAVFDMSIEKTNLIELQEGDAYEYGDVANDGMGNAAFNVGDTIGVLVGDLMRIENSTNVLYNGDWVVKSVDSVHIIFDGLPFDTAASGDITKLNYAYSSNEDVFLFLFQPSYPRTNFSNASIVFDSGGFYPIELGDVGLAWFDMINTGKQVNHDFIYSLSFGGIDTTLRYQVTMIESYFRLFSKMLNDPVKLTSVAHLPYAVFTSLDFLSPVIIRTMETTNMYYLNRITGYKESFKPCTLELIKI